MPLLRLGKPQDRHGGKERGNLPSHVHTRVKVILLVWPPFRELLSEVPERNNGRAHDEGGRKEQKKTRGRSRGGEAAAAAEAGAGAGAGGVMRPALSARKDSSVR